MAIRGSVIFLAVVNACLILLLAAVWTAHTVRSYLIRKAAEERFLGGYNFPYPTFKFFPRGKKQFLLREASMGTIRAFFLAVLSVATIDAPCYGFLWWYMPFTAVSLLALKMFHLLPPKCRTKTWAIITLRVDIANESSLRGKEDEVWPEQMTTIVRATCVALACCTIVVPLLGVVGPAAAVMTQECSSQDPLSSVVLIFPVLDLLALAAFLAYLRVYQPIGVRGEDEGLRGRLYPWFLYM